MIGSGLELGLGLRLPVSTSINCCRSEPNSNPNSNPNPHSKSYHGFISYDKVQSLMEILNDRALYIINRLCNCNNNNNNNENNNENENENENESHQLLQTNKIDDLYSLAFYCQRISASLAYFSSILSSPVIKTSTEMLLVLRGFLLHFQPILIDEDNQLLIDLTEFNIRSEEYFRKALRSPLG
jgi:hypothetical protein